jgi:hypothetical protein
VQHSPAIYCSILAYVDRQAGGQDLAFVALSPGRSGLLQTSSRGLPDDPAVLFSHALDLWEAGMIEVLAGGDGRVPAGPSGYPKLLLAGGLTDRGRSFLRAAENRGA